MSDKPGQMAKMETRDSDTAMDKAATGGSADLGEIARFAAMADEWWDPHGRFRPLHRLNPTRLAFIRDHICGHFARDRTKHTPFDGLAILDVGCGGGLLTEPMARLGALVTGIDPGEKAINVARAHGTGLGLDIDYRCTTAEAVAAANERFDVVLNMEVVEHVTDAASFLNTCVTALKPGGAMVVSTLNRTITSYALAIVGAEYVLRWLPRGTHQWHKFVRPAELRMMLETYGMEISEFTGVTYNPLADSWKLSRDLAVNYMAFAVKGE